MRAQLLHHPAAFQEGVRHSSGRPSFAQAVNKEGSPSATSALLQSVSSAPPALPPTPSPLPPVRSVLDSHPPTIRRELDIGGLRATKSKEPALIGSSDSTGLVVVNPPKRPKLVFVSKLSPSTTAEQLQAHLSSVNVAPLFCHRLKTKYETYASFCVGVDDMYFQRLCDPSTWPSDCLFKPFRGRLHSDMILSPNTNSVPRDDKK